MPLTCWSCRFSSDTGVPMAWARAGSNGSQRFTAAPQRAYKRAAGLLAKRAMGGRALFMGPVALGLVAVFEPPASWTKKARAAALAGEVVPTVKPDWDNLGKIVSDAMNAQKEFVDELCALARSLKVHVHLVHHVRKGEDERSSKRINKFDVKGSGSITDQVDNVLLVWRNKAKENEPDKREAEPDGLLIIDKQRNGEWEGQVALWFHKGAMQYLADGRGRPMDLLRLGA